MSAEPHPAAPIPAPGSTAPLAPSAAARAGTESRAEAQPAVVAQLLATEHWSLLATRSVLWSELMSRITI